MLFSLENIDYKKFARKNIVKKIKSIYKHTLEAAIIEYFYEGDHFLMKFYIFFFFSLNSKSICKHDYTAQHMNVS